MNAIPTKIPMNDLKRHFGPLRDELSAVAARVIAGGSFVLGQACSAFDAAFADYCGVGHCVGVANGTDALELALRALGIGPGARVAAVANAGMYATVAILSTGARPVYVDIDPASMTMSPAALAAAGSVDAVIATHIYGRMADMPSILAAAKGIPVVEDCAQAHGATLAGRRAGSWGTLGCFSFYPTKNLGALGDGGAVTTKDADLALKVRRLRQYGWTERYHAGLPGGRNSRLDEMQAAVLLAMLPRLDDWNAARRAIAERFRGASSGTLQIAPATPDGSDVAHLCVVRSARREALRSALEGKGIATDIHYPVPDYRQPAIESVLGPGVALPETEAATAEILTLPCFPEMTAEEIDRVATAVAQAATSGGATRGLD